MGTAHRPTSGKENRCRRTGAKDLPHPVRALARRLQISGVEGDCSGADGAHAATLWGSSRPAAPPPANHPPRPIQLRQSVGLQSISRKCTTLRRGVQRGLTADIRVISGAWCVQPHRQVVNPIARPRPSFEAAILQEDEIQPTTYDLRLTGGRSISVSVAVGSHRSQGVCPRGSRLRLRAARRTRKSPPTTRYEPLSGPPYGASQFTNPSRCPVSRGVPRVRSSGPVRRIVAISKPLPSIASKAKIAPRTALSRLRWLRGGDYYCSRRGTVWKPKLGHGHGIFPWHS